MITAKFIPEISSKIAEINSICIGKEKVFGEENYRVLIFDDEKPIYLLKIYLNDVADCFHELKYSNALVAVGCGENIHFFHVTDKHISTYELGGYFGHIYSVKDIDSDQVESNFLVASESKLFLFCIDGKIRWESEHLGIDGVVVHNIEYGIVNGAGECDPPDGWENFSVRLDNGEKAI